MLQLLVGVVVAFESSIDGGDSGEETLDRR
jgi:hypothetical protein